MHLNFHFSVRTYYNSTLQKLGTITNLQGPYLKAASNVNLSSTQLLNIKIPFKRDSSFRTQIELSTVGNTGFTIGLRINMSTNKATKKP